MYKVAVIGDRDSIYGFASAGLEIFPVLDAEECLTTLHTLIQNDYAVIYITESLYSLVAPHCGEYEESPIPAIVPIPGVSGNTGVGVQQIRKSVERAVGADILFGEN